MEMMKMGVMRPSMVKSCIVYTQNIKADMISDEKRACIIEALKRMLPQIPNKVVVIRSSLGSIERLEGRCPKCGACVSTPQYVCSICGQRISWEVEKD